MRAPSPESSCHSSDCEGDKVVHAMKRLRIDDGRALSTADEVPQNGRRKLRSPPQLEGQGMTIDEPPPVPKLTEAQRRQKMMDMLQSQLRQYKSQYSMITDGPDIAPCG